MVRGLLELLYHDDRSRVRDQADLVYRSVERIGAKGREARFTPVH